MDKKHLSAGIAFLVIAAALYYYNATHAPLRPNPVAVHEAAGVTPPSLAPAGAGTAVTSGQPAEFASAAIEGAGTKTIRLENSFIEVTFSDVAGAIRNVALEKYPATLNSPEPFIMNELHKDPMAAFVDLPGLDRTASYKLVSSTAREVTYQTTWNNQLEVTRRYTLSPDSAPNSDPYVLHLQTTFRNLTGSTVTLPTLQVALGTAAPVNAQDRGLQLNTISYVNGATQFIPRSKLQQSGGIFGIGAHPVVPEIQTTGPLQWTAVSNQFFVSIFTPDQPASGMITRRVKLLAKLQDSDASAYGITADAVFALPPIGPHGTATLGGALYVGPKEYHRLANADVFAQNQDRVMAFGWWIIRFCSALLLTLMTWMHSLVSNWGVAIVLTTLLLKIVFIPFTLSAARSAKRMQKLQPEMKALREKYKDNPQKQQAAMLELYKTHRVNPAGSCLPMLITLPFFWGFFRMLQSAAELRFQPFLWAPDLSSPDTVGHLFGVPINVLPLLLAGTMYLNTHLTPQPSVDNSQQMMMKFTPLMMLVFYYPYSCALSLYSTVNALFSIGQQLVINRMKDPEPPPAPSPKGSRGPGGKALKNVTPRRN